MARRIQHLYVEHSGEPAQPLRANAQAIHLVVEFHAQLLGSGHGSAPDQVLYVDGIHERQLGQQHRLFRRAPDADAQHPRRAPACAHGGHGLQHPLHNGVGGVQHGEFALGLRPAAFGRDRDFDCCPAHQFHVHHSRRVVFGVLARARRIGQQGHAQLVVRVEIGAAHAGIHHLLKIKRRAAVRRTLEAHVHAHLDKGVHDAGVLADRPMSLGAHAAVDKDLRNSVLGGVRFFALIGLCQAGDVIHRMVVADVLQRARDASDEIFLADYCHDGSLELSRVMDAREDWQDGSESRDSRSPFLEGLSCA